jgi:hypothetical protein
LVKYYILVLRNNSRSLEKQLILALSNEEENEETIKENYKNI